MEYLNSNIRTNLTPFAATTMSNDWYITMIMSYGWALPIESFLSATNGIAVTLVDEFRDDSFVTIEYNY